MKNLIIFSSFSGTLFCFFPSFSYHLDSFFCRFLPEIPLFSGFLRRFPEDFWHKIWFLTISRKLCDGFVNISFFTPKKLVSGAFSDRRDARLFSNAFYLFEARVTRIIRTWFWTENFRHRFVKHLDNIYIFSALFSFRWQKFSRSKFFDLKVEDFCGIFGTEDEAR